MKTQRNCILCVISANFAPTAFQRVTKYREYGNKKSFSHPGSPNGRMGYSLLTIDHSPLTIHPKSISLIFFIPSVAGISMEVRLYSELP